MTADLVCPRCRSALTAGRGGLTCSSCGQLFATTDGVSVLVAEPDQTSSRQAAFFDSSVDEEFEITRPHGQPALYRWLLAEKFRRSTSTIATRLSGARALVVCAGSGMDAEFLARSGAEVVASDISLGAARRVRERAQRFGIRLSAVVADAHHLPFRDESFDVVYVHDGLHHLDDPAAAIAEMARVARFAVCITEPASAAATRAAVKLGVAQDVEEAGNAVIRLTLNHVTGVEAAGFRPLTAHRYAMFYRHKPGVAARLLSSKVLFPLAKSLLKVGNAAIGRFGNKLVVTAVKT